MIWIIEMIVVLVVANYVIRWIDNKLNRKKQEPTIGQVVSSPLQRQKKKHTEMGQWWTETEPDALKFPGKSSSRSSAG